MSDKNVPDFLLKRDCYFDISGLLYCGKSNPYEKGRTAESRFQKAVTRLVRYKYPKANYFHVPNEGRRNLATGKRLKDEGLKKGVSDCLFDNPRKGYHGLRIELKVEGGKVADEQKQYLIDVINEGYFGAVCWNLESVEMILNWYFE